MADMDTSTRVLLLIPFLSFCCVQSVWAQAPLQCVDLFTKAKSIVGHFGPVRTRLSQNELEKLERIVGHKVRQADLQRVARAFAARPDYYRHLKATLDLILRQDDLRIYIGEHFVDYLVVRSRALRLSNAKIVEALDLFLFRTVERIVNQNSKGKDRELLIENLQQLLMAMSEGGKEGVPLQRGLKRDSDLGRALLRISELPTGEATLEALSIRTMALLFILRGNRVDDVLEGEGRLSIAVQFLEKLGSLDAPAGARIVLSLFSPFPYRSAYERTGPIDATGLINFLRAIADNGVLGMEAVRVSVLMTKLEIIGNFQQLTNSLPHYTLVLPILLKDTSHHNALFLFAKNLTEPSRFRNLETGTNPLREMFGNIFFRFMRELGSSH